MSKSTRILILSDFFVLIALVGFATGIIAPFPDWVIFGAGVAGLGVVGFLITRVWSWIETRP